MIPKTIHYCWFGNNPKPDIVTKCISSWHKFCPDWEIIEWNETNFDVSCHPFMQEAYAAKKWAFVTDVARLLIVRQYGGVYLDTDVELLAPLEEVTRYDCFFAFESNLVVATGLGFGAVPQHPYVNAMLEEYSGLHFAADKSMTPCPHLNTKALKRSCPGFVLNGEVTYIVDSCIFYSVKDFNRLAKHHGMKSWVDGPDTKPRRRSKLGIKIQSWLQKPKHLSFVDKHFGERALRLYSFFAYDLFDCGPGYFVRRLLAKLRR